MDEAFLLRLRAAFRVEAQEHLQALSEGLLAIERHLTSQDAGKGDQPPIAALTETIFREAHSLKGAARAVNFDDIETICQALEDIFAEWKSGRLPQSTPTAGSTPIGARFDPLYAAFDAMQAVLNATETAAQPLPFSQAQIREIVQAIHAVQTGSAQTGTIQTGNAPDSSAPTKLQTPSESKPESQTQSPPAHNGSTPNGTIANETTPHPTAAISSAITPPALPAAEATPPTFSKASEVAPEYSAQPAKNAPTQSTPISAPTPVPATTTISSAAPETIRIATEKLDTLLLQAEEMVALKMTARQRARELRELQEHLAAWRREENKRSHDFRAQQVNLAQQLEAQERQHNYWRALESKLSTLTKNAERDLHSVDGLVDNLLEDTKKLLMQPFSTMLAIFPKLVRDLAREQDKEIEFEIRGGDIEIDKRILEEMKAPLTHLLRNAVDHGLEEAAARIQNGKLVRGHLAIHISQIGGKVQIEIVDDGGGIAPEAVKAAAVRNGVLAPTEVERMDDDEALQLIFRSAVSTKANVTELSGRGLGMAIVREKVENLGGDIALETRVGSGTTFRISLPLTLATFRGLLIEEAGQLFVLPSLGIERVLRARRDAIKTVEGRPTLGVDGEVLALRSLHEVLGIARSTPASSSSHRSASHSSASQTASQTGNFLMVVVLGSGGERIAFTTDLILEEQEILLKSFEKPLLRVRHFAGATVLGSGRVAPVLNVADLLQTALRGGAAPASLQPESDSEREARRVPRVLVADDSITSRMLIKNVLEAAGYAVQTAVDGQDALTELRAGEFDLLVSDVDMPRLNGFGLTEQVRADARLAALPVVLVTGRQTSEDRERGMDVGASAYIVKSSFDQNNLLEVVRRLL